MLWFDYRDDTIYCSVCKQKFGKCYNEINSDLKVPATYTVTTRLELTNGAVFYKTGEIRNMQGVWAENTQTLTSGSIGGTNITLTSRAKFNSTWKALYDMYTLTYVKINGIESQLNFCSYDVENDPNRIMAIPDSIEPLILSISSDDSGAMNWNKSKPIIISGTENYCNTVKVKILDDENTEVFSGETTVTNGSYSISCIPDVEADLEGRTFKAIVTDACDNSTEQEFTISKIDSIPPEVTSNAEVGGEWAREKSFTATASDHGIGNVQIAFNDVADYELVKANGTEYTREYKIVGDVYSPTKARVFYKDELNNISSQEITIDKLDNTAPTITGSRFDNNKLILEANDIKEGMGEGSGVVKYRFITSNTQYENPVVSNADSIEVLASEDMIIPNIAGVKYVYVVAEDNVGNVSEVYEVEVPHLDLRTEVNLSAANGKGTVELDWSTFELEDMYYVVYRKEKTAKEWTKIVSLEDKLTAKKYTDNLGNDKAKPSAPTINITGNSVGNSIDISTVATDNGTNYVYYVEAYDAIMGTLLKSSNK